LASNGIKDFAERKQKTAALWMVAPNQRTSRLVKEGREDHFIVLPKSLIERKPANSIAKPNPVLLQISPPFNDKSLNGDLKSEIFSTFPVQHRTTILKQFFAHSGLLKIHCNIFVM
jgi:hypothetical protein